MGEAPIRRSFKGSRGAFFFERGPGVGTTWGAVAAPESEAAGCAIGGAGVGCDMQWLNDFLSGDKSFGSLAFLAACGIAVLVVLAIVYRLVFAHRLRVPGGRTRQPRLGLVDAFSLDGQRQLVLIRRDNVEHLVMIGGPNDVLVESQINRAYAPVRETNLAAATPARRRNDPVVTSAPDPAAAVALPAEPPAAPPAPIVASVEVQPIRPRTVPAAPAPGSSAPPAPPPAARPAPPRAAAKGLEPAQAIPVSPPHPRPLPARPSMPPPIIPAAAPIGRPNVTRLTDKQPHPAPPAQAARPGPGVPAAAPIAEPTAAPNSAKTEPAAPSPKPEPSVAPPGAAKTSVAPVEAAPIAKPEAKSDAKVEAKVDRPASVPTAGGPPAETNRPPTAHGAEPPPAPAEKPAPKVADPFTGLDSLEAEMSRLLGRDQLN